MTVQGTVEGRGMQNQWRLQAQETMQLTLHVAPATSCPTTRDVACGGEDGLNASEGREPRAVNTEGEGLSAPGLPSGSEVSKRPGVERQADAKRGRWGESLVEGASVVEIEDSQPKE